MDRSHSFGVKACPCPILFSFYPVARRGRSRSLGIKLASVLYPNPFLFPFTPLLGLMNEIFLVAPVCRAPALYLLI